MSVRAMVLNDPAAGLPQQDHELHAVRHGVRRRLPAARLNGSGVGYDDVYSDQWGWLNALQVSAVGLVE